MTIIVQIGRRVPKNWFKRQVVKAKGLMTFQENIWQIIKQSMTKAKKQANSSNTGIKFTIQYNDESEDMHYNLEWLKVMIQGTREQEEEEYRESLTMYKSLGNIIKKELNLEENITKSGKEMKRQFKTKMLNLSQVDQVYQKGFGALQEDDKANISNKLLEMGILTHIEKKDDFDSREPYYPSN